MNLVLGSGSVWEWEEEVGQPMLSAFPSAGALPGPGLSFCIPALQLLQCPFASVGSTKEKEVAGATRAAT